MRSRTTIALAGILALAFGLRVWGLGWGLPYAFHADEENYLPGAVGMLFKGDLNPHYFANPPLLTYTVLAELIGYLGLGRLLGFLQSAGDIAHQLLVNPSPLYLLARMNGALAGTATVLVTFLAVRRLLGSRAALASALLLAVAFLQVRDSHYVVNDVPAAFLLMVSFYFAARVAAPATTVDPPVGAGVSAGPSTALPGEGDGTPLRDKEAADNAVVTTPVVRLPGLRTTEVVTTGTHPAAKVLRHEVATPWRDYILSGLFLGLAVATKYNVGLGAVFLLATHLTRQRKPGDLWRVKTHLPLVAAGILSLLAFLLANPYSLLDYPAFVKGVAGQYRWASDPFSTTDTSMAATILRALSVGTSPVILAASVLGLGLLAHRHPRRAILVGAFPLAYLAFFLFGSSLFYARFAMPLIPFVALLAGYAVVGLAERLPSAGWRTRAATVAVILLALQPLVVDLKHDYLLRQEDTRLLLGSWIEENVPPGSKLAAEGYSFIDSRGRQTDPKKLEYEVAQPSSLQANSLEYYTQEKFDYLISSSYVYGRYPLDPAAHQGAIDFYRQLGQSYTLVAEFNPTPDGRELPFLMDDEITPIWTVMERDRPGPTIKVYRVGQPPNYTVRWLDASVPSNMTAGQTLIVPVTLQNGGNLTWPSEGYTPVRVGYRWLDGTGREVKGPDLHSPLTAEVKPGDQVTAQVTLVAPATPGAYTLQLDLVWENFAWFSKKGAATKGIRVTVK